MENRHSPKKPDISTWIQWCKKNAAQVRRNFSRSHTAKKAEFEFDVLAKQTPDAIVLPFRKEITDLVDAVGKSGQSGGSVPFYANIISSVVKKLILQEPLGYITGEDWEWMDVSDYPNDGRRLYQNIRCTGLFKEDVVGPAHYVDAIVFDGDVGGRFTSNGSVTLPNGKKLGSTQYVRSFPFHPKTFYIKVNDQRWEDKTETVRDPDGDWWTHTIKSISEVNEALRFYDFKPCK